MSDVVIVPGNYHCPACQREIYSRKRKTCEFCGTELPEKVRLSPEEIEAVEKEIEEIHARREAEKAEEEKRRAAAAAAAGATSAAFISVSAIH